MDFEVGFPWILRLDSHDSTEKGPGFLAKEPRRALINMASVRSGVRKNVPI